MAVRITVSGTGGVSGGKSGEASLFNLPSFDLSFGLRIRRFTLLDVFLAGAHAQGFCSVAMKRHYRVQDGQPALESMEEAFSLLRSLSVIDWTGYLLGTMPWVVGLLYFWADLSASPLADRHLLPACLVLVGLFFLAKLSQSFLGDRLQSLARGAAAEPWGVRRSVRTVFLHTVIQPSGLFLIPIAAVLILPLGWVLAFYQSATLLAAGDGATAGSVLKGAGRRALLWPVQNHGVLGLLSLLAFFLFTNFLALSFLIPQLLKMLLGIETVFTHSPWSTLNSTLIFTLLALTCLCLDPLFKAVFVIRTFQGDSVRNGEDLRAELRRWRASRASVTLVVLLLAVTLKGVTGELGAVVPAGAIQRVAPEELDRSIDRTLSRPDYEWRLPRDEPKPMSTENLTGWAGFWDRLEKQIKPIVEWTRTTLTDGIAWVRKLFGNTKPRESERVQFDWLSPAETLFYLAILVVCGAFGVLLTRWWRTRIALVATPSVSSRIETTPDLRREEVLASQLPEEEWWKLGGDLLSRGEPRLAMRAYFLSSLAHLATRNLVTVAPFKSNRDYRSELSRRGHALPSMRFLFDENVGAFERVWYGRDSVESPEVEAFAKRVQRIQKGDA